MAQKASFARKDTVETSLNFGEGYGEVVEISSVVHQFPANKDTGEQYEPGTVVKMMIQRTQQDGTHFAEDPVEELFSCGSLEKFHPGVLEGPDDEDAEDKGSAVGAEGNCIVAVEGASMNRRSKWVKFVNSLEEAGFKPEVLEKGYLPDLVGLRAFFHSIKLPKEADRTYKRDPQALVVKTITKFPYGGSAAKGGKAQAAAASTASSGKGKGKGTAAASAPAPAIESAASGEVAPEIHEIAVNSLQTIAGKNPGQTLTQQKICGKLYTVLSAAKVPTAQHKPVMDCFKNDAWLAETCSDMDLTFDGGNVTFPAAA